MLPSVRAILLGGTTLQPTIRVIVGDSFDSRVAFTRASTATFVGSNGLIQTASSGVPRFGYDPTTLAPLGYFSEEARTNLLLRSQDFSNAVWQVNNGAAKVDVAGVNSPDGTANAYEVSFGATGGSIDAASSIYQTGFSTVNGTVYANTVYVRAKSGTTTLRLAFNDSVNPTIGSSALTVTDTAWTRLPLIATSGASALSYFLIKNNTAGTTSNLYIACAQVEAASTNYPGPTSYIPTTSATVTRAADVASITGSFSPATIVTTITPSGDYNEAGMIAELGSDASNNNFIGKFNSTATAVGKRWIGVTQVGGAVQAAIPIGSDGAAVQAKLAYGFDTNNFGFAADAALIGTDASGTIPTVTSLSIGLRTLGGNAFWFNGHIKQLDYYKARLPNATLQRLTS